MGFAIGYQSTETISPALQAEVIEAAHKLAEGRTWLRCAPVCLSDENGYLAGVSKPNFTPHPSDVASAKQEALPIGKVSDMLDILCALSSEFDIDWEIAHDYSEGPLGYIRQGRCDEVVRTQCDAFDGVSEDFPDGYDEDR